MITQAVTVASLRERITLQTLALVPDGEGGYHQSWANCETIWARVEPSKDLKHSETYKVSFRAGCLLKPKMRLVWQGKPYKFLSTPKTDEEKAWSFVWVEAMA